MAVKKTTRPSLIPVPYFLGGSVGSLFTSKQGRSVLLSLFLIFGFGLTVYFCWQQVSEKVLASSDYRVDLEDIVISTPPPWIHSDIRADAFHDLSVEGPLFIMDENIMQRIKDVFALHDWVEQVKRVSKHFPARIEVELQYRQPACIVVTPGRWFPVDVHGYVLPWSDFSHSELEKIPQVVGIKTLPVISVGAYWNDKQVDAAARIGAALLPFWQEFKLEKIQPIQVSSGTSPKEIKEFELTTKSGTVILWGDSPDPNSSSSQTPLGLSNKEKFARLKHYFEKHGTLDVAGNRFLDLRVPASKVAKKTT